MVTISVGSGTRGSGGALSVLSGRNAVNTGGAFMVERRRRSDHEWCDHHRMISLDAPRDKLKQKAGPFGAAALHDMPSFVVCRGQCNRPVVSESVGCYACLATMGFNGGKEAVTVFLSLSRARVASWRLAPWWLKTNTPSTRIGIRTWRSAIADLKGSPPGAPSGALGEGNPGWVWRCDAAISRFHKKNMPFCTFFTCSQNTQMTSCSLISKVFGHV